MTKANIYSFAAAAALSLLILPSCSQKDEILDTETYSVEFVAVKGSDDEAVWTRALEEGPNNYLYAPWEEGETVQVFKVNPSAQSPQEAYVSVGTLTAQSSGSTTTLKGKLTGLFTLGDRLFFSYRHGLVFDYRGQNGTLEDIADNYDYATTSSSISKISSGAIILSSDKLRFDSLQSIFKLTLKDASGGALNASKLVLQSTSTYEDQDGQLVEYEALAQLAGVINNADSYLAGPIEIIPQSPTNVFFVALYGYSHGDPFVIKATVGEETYTFSTDNFRYYSDSYYVYDVIMTNPVTDPDVELDGDASLRYGQGTIGSLD